MSTSARVGMAGVAMLAGGWASVAGAAAVAAPAALPVAAVAAGAGASVDFAMLVWAPLLLLTLGCMLLFAWLVWSDVRAERRARMPASRADELPLECGRVAGRAVLVAPDLAWRRDARASTEGRRLLEVCERAAR
jgi:hypothetical protein